MVTARALGVNIDLPGAPSLRDLRALIRDEVGEIAEDAAAEVVARLRPIIPQIVGSAMDAALPRLRAEVPGLVRTALGAIAVPRGAKAALAVAGTLLATSAVFSVLGWLRSAR